MTEEDKTIVFIALSNLILISEDKLKEDSLNKEDKELLVYLIDKSLILLDNYKSDIVEQNIDRPKW